MGACYTFGAKEKLETTSNQQIKQQVDLEISKNEN